MHKKVLKFSEAKFYLYHSTKIAKARPAFDEIPKKLWKYSKLKFFENPFNKDKSVVL